MAEVTKVRDTLFRERRCMFAQEDGFAEYFVGGRRRIDELRRGEIGWRIGDSGSAVHSAGGAGVFSGASGSVEAGSRNPVRANLNCRGIFRRAGKRLGECAHARTGFLLLDFFAGGMVLSWAAIAGRNCRVDLWSLRMTE